MIGLITNVGDLINALQGYDPLTPVSFNYNGNRILDCTSVEDINRLTDGEYNEVELYLED